MYWYWMVFLNTSALKVCYMTAYVLQENGFTKPKCPFTSEKNQFWWQWEKFEH